MSNASEILEGWTNYLKGSDNATLNVARGRAKICAECPVASRGLHTAILPDHCISEIEGLYCDKKKGGCGCPLSPAVRSKSKKCPLNKW